MTGLIVVRYSKHRAGFVHLYLRANMCQDSQQETPILLPCSKLNNFLSSEAIFGLKTTIWFTFEAFKAATRTYMDCKGTRGSADSCLMCRNLF